MTLKQAILENPYDLNKGNLSAYCRYLRYNVDGFYTKTNDEVKTLLKDYTEREGKRMKIKTTVTEIECTANELRQSTTLSDGLYNLLRGFFNNMTSDCEDDIEDEDTTEEEDKE